VACSGGTLFAISPWLGLIALFTFIIILLICRYVSLGSMICMLLPAFAVFIPRIAYLYLFENNLLYNLNYVYTPTLTIKVWLMGIILCNSIIVIIRHSSNIKRLINREEKRFI
jgi:glycerol-3-phosphate acyltransferase PlsY